MINDISFTQGKMLILRRIISVLAFLIICSSLVILWIGFIPFHQRPSSLIPAINNIFEFINYGKKSFWYCTSSIIFSVFYIIFSVKSIIAIARALKEIKKWLISTQDNKDSRESTRSVILDSNSSIMRILSLYVFSYIISDFNINVKSIIIISVLLLINLATNIVMILIYKGNLTHSLVTSFTQTIFLSLIVVFAFSSHNIQLIDSIQATGHLFYVLHIEDISGTVLINILCDNIILPIINLIMLISIIRSYISLNKFNYIEKDTAKSIVIRNIIFIVAIIIVSGYANHFSVISDYLNIVWQNITFIFITAIIYISSFITEACVKDTKFSKPEETVSSFNVIESEKQEAAKNSET